MNNSLNIEEPVNVDRLPDLRERENDLVRMIEAIGSLSNTKEWSTLKTLMFDGVVESLERRMTSEANKMPLNDKELYKLQGQLAWAKKYSKLENLQDQLRLELTNIRKIKPPDGAGNGS